MILIEIIKIIPFLIIGLITTYIAYGQYKLEKSKLDKELYEKRLRVYQRFYSVYFDLAIKSKIDEPVLHKITFMLEERHFLFSKKINKEFDDFVLEFWKARELELNNKKSESKKKTDEIVNRAELFLEKFREEMAIKYKKE